MSWRNVNEQRTAQYISVRSAINLSHIARITTQTALHRQQTKHRRLFKKSEQEIYYLKVIYSAAVYFTTGKQVIFSEFYKAIERKLFLSLIWFRLHIDGVILVYPVTSKILPVLKIIVYQTITFWTNSVSNFILFF